MSEQYNQEPPAAPPVDNEPLTSVQSQIGLVLTAAATAVAFVFHKDYSPIVPALTVIAFSFYGGAVAIARAMKHKTIVQAQTHVQLQRMAQAHDRDALQREFSTLSGRLTALEKVWAEKTVPKTSTPRKSTPAKKTAQRR